MWIRIYQRKICPTLRNNNNRCLIVGMCVCIKWSNAGGDGKCGGCDRIHAQLNMVHRWKRQATEDETTRNEKTVTDKNIINLMIAFDLSLIKIYMYISSCTKHKRNVIVCLEKQLNFRPLHIVPTNTISSLGNLMINRMTSPPDTFPSFLYTLTYTVLYIFAI